MLIMDLGVLWGFNNRAYEGPQRRLKPGILEHVFCSERTTIMPIIIMSWVLLLCVCVLKHVCVYSQSDLVQPVITMTCYSVCLDTMITKHT